MIPPARFRELPRAPRSADLPSLPNSLHPIDADPPSGLVPLAPRGSAPLRSPERELHTRRLEELGRLAAGIVHDVNNYLTVVLGEAELLLDSDTGEPSSGLGAIRDAALRARTLTRGALALSREEDPAPRALDVAASLSDTVGFLARLTGPGIHLRARFDDGLPPVLLPPQHLDQVIVNLAVNARDAMPEGGTLEVTAEVDRGMAQSRGGGGRPAGVRLCVTDTGEGMDEATREQIFEPFFTTKGPEAGTGLGLATVSAIVREAGGAIRVASSPGEGTTFTVHLPAAPVEWSTSAGRTLPAPSPATTSTHRPEPTAGTVLLVEDDPQVRALVRRCLAREGYRVLEASTGSEALRTVEEVGPEVQLLLTDVNLPDIDGGGLWREASRGIIGMRVAFMSGLQREDLPHLEVDPERDGFLSKPFDVDELVAEVRRVLEDR